MDLMEALLMGSLMAKGPGGGGETRVAVGGANPVIAAQDNTCYVCTEAVASITLSALPAEGLFEIVFLAGAAAPELIGPQGQAITLQEGSELTADQINDVSVRCCTVAGASMALAAVGQYEAPTETEAVG